jgi:hypothetical protein
MGQGFIVTHGDTDAAGMPGCGGQKSAFQSNITSAKNRETPAKGDDFIDHLDKQIDALLPGQP